MARDEERKPRARKSGEEVKPRKPPEAKAGRSRAKPAPVDPSRATAATQEVRDLDAQGGDQARSASRSRATSSAALDRAAEPTARDFLDPAHDEVARRAYHRWRETGNEDAFDNWIEAERQLREEQIRREG